MKKIVLILMSLVLALGAVTLEEKIENATSGEFNGTSYDKLVILDSGEIVTGGWEYDGSVNGELDIAIVGSSLNGVNSIIDLETHEIKFGNTTSSFDMYNVVVKNGLIELVGQLSVQTSPKSKIENCTFYEMLGAAFRTDNMGEENVEMLNNVFVNTQAVGWTTPYGNWMPDGVAVFSYIWAGMIDSIMKLHDNVSFGSYFEKTYTAGPHNGETLSGEFWQCCESCGGGDINSIPWSEAEFSDYFWGNSEGVDPILDSPASMKYCATATFASGKGVLANYSADIDDSQITQNFELIGNYPNPFNPTTDIRFTLSENSEVKISIFNSNGEFINELVNSRLNRGLNSITFNADGLNSGTYFYVLNVDGVSTSSKMILIK
ncbi:MAG: T9SS type A sorting domain-containing protein [Candidatus Delongbacteria bacterium]|nr:T9SS type A sorting domain-containing protein [Candidatus Delongbacteria bacterium]MBN2835665.1 T9SS type A sorting domain-containing protein [Candidatus Delongbacteria bacterium]